MAKSVVQTVASVVLSLSILVVVPPRLLAQAATAAVLGTVTDQSGAAVPGVAVDVKNSATGVSQTAISESRGRYRVTKLPLGRYEVKAELQGFQTAVHKDVEVAVGSERVVDFVLSVGQVSESVTVSYDGK